MTVIARQSTPSQQQERSGASAILPPVVGLKQDTSTSSVETFKSILWTLSSTASNSSEAQKFNFKDLATGNNLSKYFFASKDGLLENNGSAWVKSNAEEYFLHGNSLIDKKGNKLGDIALHPSSNKNIQEGQDLLKGTFTFKTSDGKIFCVDANQLANIGYPELKAGVIRLGLPDKSATIQANFNLINIKPLVSTDDPRFPHGVKYSSTAIDTYSLGTKPNDNILVSLDPSKLKKGVTLQIANETFVIANLSKDEILLSKTQNSNPIAKINMNNLSFERKVACPTHFFDPYKPGSLALAEAGWLNDPSIKIS